MHLLQATLCSAKCPEQLQLLCASILREMSPRDDLSLSCDHIQSTRQLSLVASVLLAQVPWPSLLKWASLPWVTLGCQRTAPVRAPTCGTGGLGVASPSVLPHFRLSLVYQSSDTCVLVEATETPTSPHPPASTDSSCLPTHPPTASPCLPLLPPHPPTYRFLLTPRPHSYLPPFPPVSSRLWGSSRAL